MAVEDSSAARIQGLSQLPGGHKPQEQQHRTLKSNTGGYRQQSHTSQTLRERGRIYTSVPKPCGGRMTFSATHGLLSPPLHLLRRKFLGHELYQNQE